MANLPPSSGMVTRAGNRDGSASQQNDATDSCAGGGPCACRHALHIDKLEPPALAPSDRRTARLDSIVHHIGLALGERPAASFAKRLMLPVSKDTMLGAVFRVGKADPRRLHLRAVES